MFMVTEDERAAIRRAYDESGEWAAVVELRRHFRIDSNEDALLSVRSIIRWPPAPSSTPRSPRNRSTA